ncbi:cytochrome P450 CYP736A12-like [Malania oleifera]|uniref:cytochrome P450 CYP736A12-like n=1 Tax=Malania oleifera TaxID=397392 RepID=UPI0025AE5F83|nr:cytochrome P450 CYP736A12-like [Malania oleifera]
MSPAIVVVFAVVLGALWLFDHLRRRNGPKPPPGPPAFPIIGNLHLLGDLPHSNLRRLAQKYGPIMSMRLGQVPTVVVSTPAAAELFLKTHDLVFASRPRLQAPEYLSYGNKGVGFSQYGPYWRDVRRICTVNLLSPGKIESYGGLRKEEVGSLVRWLKEAAAEREVANVTVKLSVLMEDITCRMLFGRSRDERFELKKVVREFLFLTGSSNIGDFIPWLKPLDLQGLKRRMKATGKAFDSILEIMIDEHILDGSGRSSTGSHGDFMDMMLSLMNESQYSQDESLRIIDRTNIKAVLIDLLVGGTDSSSSTVEWAISELIRQPKLMRKLQDEIKSIVGKKEFVDEADLPRMAYLDNVVKETLRLHPVSPLLAPHESTEDITINGYFIPKKSRILVNAWAIGRDPSAWPNSPEEFNPERFVGSEVDLQGRDFQLIPFGSGRRACPGMRLGLTTVRLVLAHLVHCFDWELPGGVSPSKLDMSQKFAGLVSPRAHPLLAVPVYRFQS